MSTMKSAQTVYYGPSTSTYPSAGSVSKNETITALWTESTWCYIEYNVTGSTNKKRGYVPTSTINLTQSVSTIPASGAGSRYVQTACSVYFGPNTSTYPTAGSLSYGETVQYLGVKDSSTQYAFVEYSVTGTSQKKRAWAYANNFATVLPNPTPSGYTTYKKGSTIPSGLPLAGATVTQGWNDKTTNNKGHLGYDMTGFTYARPLFAGTVVSVVTNNQSASGRAVCVSHTVNGVSFYTTYCHLASVSVSANDVVTTSTNLGVIGGSGNSSDTTYGVHLHVCAYTGAPSTNPMGYCDSSRRKTFEQVTSYANAYYYGPDQTKFPRCDGRCFYDPYGVVTSNAAVIKQYHP